MFQIDKLNPRLLISGIWAAGLIIFLALGYWNLADIKRDMDNRLLGDAGHLASQLAGLLSLPDWDPDEITARAIVTAAMEDDRLYAVKVDIGETMLDGQRRNYLWEPMPWDDEIADNCVEGMSSFRHGGQKAGAVRVWIAQRGNQEEYAIFFRREVWRFAIVAASWTFMAIFLFLRWRPASAEDSVSRSADPVENTLEGIRGEKAFNASAPAGLVNADLGRRHQRDNTDAWLVTAGMFRQTFARGPALIGRLFADGEMAGLCHLGRMLEQAAPCVGATNLALAARAMQSALNDPECETKALPVEQCARELEAVLEALSGANRWRPEPGRDK